MRVGVVEFTNTLRLAVGLERFLPGAELVRATPARIAADLEAGRLDVGLVPVAALAANPDWAVVPGLGIAAEGPVSSVLLLSRVPLADLRRLTLDPASRTSNVLARLWLEAKLGRPLTVEAGPADLATRLDRGEATVAIGDAALFFDGEALERVDLGLAWTEWTGLPFVFAVWAGPGAGDPALASALHCCYETNRDRVEELVRDAFPADDGKRRWAAAYLRENIRHELGPREREGLDEFLRRGRAGGAFRERARTHVD
jgi:predicted solute-binding protein